MAFLLPGPSELQSLQVLSFKAARCCVLLNGLWLLQMDLAENQPQLLSCCSVQPTDGEPPAAVHRCVCADTLFSLCSSGLICILYWENKETPTSTETTKLS